MTQVASTDKEWLGWIEVQKAAIQQEDRAKAIVLIDAYLAMHPPRDLHRQALGFRGSLRQEQGELRAAKADFLAAWELTEKPNFERYTLEESIAVVYRLLGQHEEAEHWCLEAVKTADSDPKTSGASSLQKLLDLRGEQGLRADEESLVERVIRQAWHLLRVPGEPELDHLEATIRELIAAQGRPFSAELPPKPRAL